MKTFAILEDNFVKDVVLFENEELLKNLYPDKKFVEVKENRIASIGMEYDELDGYFYWPQKFFSWTKKEGEWIPPIPYPEEQFYNEPWRDINKNLLISEEKMQGLFFNSAGVPAEYTWEWDEENLNWKKKFINFYEKPLAGRYTSDNYAE